MGRKHLFLPILLCVFFILAQTGILLFIELGAIMAYREIGSPVARKVTTCRYDPSCSLYGLHALQDNGFWKGNLQITQRLAMCSPIGMVIDAFREEP